LATRINLTAIEPEKALSVPKHGIGWRLRKVLYVLHMCLGVAASLYFCVMSCSGVSLVFKEELASWLSNPPNIQVLSKLAPLSEVVKSVESKYPEQQVSGLIYPLEPARSLLVYVLSKDGVYSPVSVNQYNASVIGPAPENQVLKFLQELHHNLLFSKTGRKVNGCGGLVLFVLALSGIGLFLRGIKYCFHTLKMKWQGHTSVIAWSIHQQIGFFLLPSLLIWGVSGFSFGFRQEFERAVNVVLPVSSLTKGARKKKGKTSFSEHAGVSAAVPEVPPTSALDPAHSLDLLIPLATEACPGQKVVRISTAIDGDDVAKVWLTNSNSLNKADNTEVDISASRGIVTSISRPEKRASGDILLIGLQHLHFGNFGGTPIKLVWVVIGLSPLILSVTGLMMWWHKRFR
jgi:uncharacterized iron-regulated membrane protein